MSDILQLYLAAILFIAGFGLLSHFERKRTKAMPRAQPDAPPAGEIDETVQRPGTAEPGQMNLSEAGVERISDRILEKLAKHIGPGSAPQQR